MIKIRTHLNSQNDGYILLGSLIITLFLSLVLAAAVMRGEMHMSFTLHRQLAQEAFYVAESGLNRAVFELRSNSKWRPGQDGVPSIVDVPLTEQSGQQGKTVGYYSIEVATAPDFNGWKTVWVKSTGRDSMKQTTRTIVGRLLIENPARFLVSTLGDLRVGSGAAIDADVLAQDIYFEVNESLPSPQKDILVRDDIYYLNSVNGQNNPAVHFDSDSKILRSPSITFPGVDTDRYRELAKSMASTDEAIYINGDLTVDLDDLDDLVASGKGDRLKLIYAEGDIKIEGNYAQSLLVVAGGILYIQADVIPSESLDPAPQIGLFAKEDVVIPANVRTDNGNLTVDGFVMADGEGGNSPGEFRSDSAPYSFGTLNFKGAISVRGEGRTAVNLNAFQQRIYAYNPDLSDRRSIPFIPFIANIISWKETSSQDTFPPAQ